jgi:UDP:flavonoid glycosyltransferase YjiC (YdhE family)
LTVVFYITGHGFGHASRVIEVINELIVRERDLQVQIRTTAAPWLFDLTVRQGFTYEAVETDTGIVQIDSLRLDERASVERAAAFMASFDARVEQEAAVLSAMDAKLVVADMPALGFAAAARAGVPAVAMGNFTWDWAYSAYPGMRGIVEAIAAAYADAHLALRLPMWGGFGAFRVVRDVPFVARRSTRDPADTRRALRLPEGKRLVFPSFGGHGLAGLDEAGKLDDYHVLLSLDEKRLYAEGFRYEDVVRAADVVVTKPGYGIIAECLANDTALLYTDRGNFIEYDVLVGAMPRFLRAAYINHDDLFAGRWKAHLDALLAQPAPPERPATNGAEVIADVLMTLSD